VSKDTALLVLSMILPLLAAIALVVVAIIIIVDKITDYRKAIFLSTVEGERLSRIDTFCDLAQVPFALKTHVSELVKSAPASAHLQSKFKADLLKVISLFEIQDRVPMQQYSRWACKVRPTPFTLKNTVLTSLRQFFALSSIGRNEFTAVPSDDTGHQPDALESAGVQESFKTYLFKTIDTKFVRKVSFTNIALDQSLKVYNKSNSEPLMKPPMFSPRNMLDEFKRDKCIEYGWEETHTLFSSDRSRPDDHEQQNQRQQLDFIATVIKFAERPIENPKGEIDQNNEELYVLQVTEDEKCAELSSKIFDYAVVRSRDAPCDPRFGYVIRNVIRTGNQTTFELFSLDDGFEKLQLSAGADPSKPYELTLKFEDPYLIDDNFIEYAFRCEPPPLHHLLHPTPFFIALLSPNPPPLTDPMHLSTRPWRLLSVVYTAPILQLYPSLHQVALRSASSHAAAASRRAERLQLTGCGELQKMEKNFLEDLRQILALK
jgi:hypothetical protein